MGLVFIATYLKKFMNLKNIRLIDANFDNIIETTKKYSPDLVGISSMTVDYNKAMKASKDIKQALDIPVLIGGVHISVLPSCINGFDIGAIGEGEQTMLELMRIYERSGDFPKKELNKTKGIVFKEGNKLTITERRDLVEPLDRIPIPDRSYLNKKYFKPKWHPYYQKKEIVQDIMTSRGCPYNCVFCATSVFWRRIPRFHSPEHVYEEVEQLIDEYKVEHINIADDLFTMNKERLRKIVSLFEQNRINKRITFDCMARANLLDDEICRLLKKMNVKSLYFGFESGSERMLKFLKRGTVTVNDNKKAMVLCRKYGFKMVGSFIFGSPYETIGDMKKTIELMKFMRKNIKDADIVQFVMTPFPGTDVWEIAKERGKVRDDMKNWNELDQHNLENPKLLDNNVDRNNFNEIFVEARATADSIKIGKQWVVNKLRYDSSRLIKKVLSNPRRAIELLKAKLAE